MAKTERQERPGTVLGQLDESATALLHSLKTLDATARDAIGMDRVGTGIRGVTSLLEGVRRARSVAGSDRG